MKNFDPRKIAEKIFRQRAEVIDLFVKTFLLTEVKDLDRFSTGSLELVEQHTNDLKNFTSTYRCQYIPFDELEKKKRRLIRQKATQELLKETRQAAIEDALEEIASFGIPKIYNHVRSKLLLNLVNPKD